MTQTCFRFLVVTLLGLFLSFGLRPSSPLWADTQQWDASDLPPGGLYLATASPGKLVRAPTVSADVDINITGPIVRTRVVQSFTNHTDAWVEGIYTYPLPKGSAVDTLEMKIGERTIIGEIQEKQKAEATYKAARAAGKRASLVRQHRPNIFSTKLANMGPGETIQIAIEYQDLIMPQDGLFELRFPMVIRPRFNPGIPLHSPNKGWSFATDQVPDGTHITPPIMTGGDTRQNLINLSVSLEAGFPIQQITSPSHQLTVNRGDNSAQINTKGSIKADQDFILRWSPMADASPHVGLFSQKTSQGHHSLLMIMPSIDREAVIKTPPREMIIILDRSGSMGGQAMVQAKAAVRQSLDYLRPGDRFNIIAFDNVLDPLFPHSMTVHTDSINAAHRFLDGVDARGGTHMAPAISAALDSPEHDGFLRQVIFITDGAVGNEKALMALVKSSLRKARLFAVGIGSAPNSYFMEEIAESGRGFALKIAPGDQIQNAMTKLFAKIQTPGLTGLNLTGSKMHNVKITPNPLPDVYLGEPLIITMKGKLSDDLTITGTIGNKAWSQNIDLNTIKTGKGIAGLWARREIQATNRSYIGRHSMTDQKLLRNKILKLALDYGLVSKFTSLVAVDKTPARSENDPLFARDVPTHLPAGLKWPNRKVYTIFGGDRGQAPTVTPRATATSMKFYLLIGFCLMLLGIGIRFAGHRKYRAKNL